MNISHPKVTIQYSNPYSYQLETINLIRSIAENNDVEVLYLYTNTMKTKDWLNMTLYFLLQKAEECIRQLNDHDTVGCNFEKTHYQGNCWWSKSSYLKTLSYLPMIHKKDAVDWLCMNHLGKHHEIHRSGVNHAEYCYPSFLYQI
jgi:hypothetical protein